MSPRLRTSTTSDETIYACQTNASSSTITLPLPEYTKSSCAPTYTPTPLADEETVQYNPLSGSGIPANGTFTRKWKSLTISLRGQEEGASIPKYDRKGLVAGELEINCPGEVLEVWLQLKGEMSVCVANVGAKAPKVLRQDVLLWKKEGERCPETLPFSLRFPSRFSDGQKAWKLPPTFQATFLSFPSVFTNCLYTLTVSVTRRKSFRILSWVRNKKYTIPLEYQPRHRPSPPVPRCDSVLQSANSNPEGWEQLLSTMKAKPGGEMRSVGYAMLVPGSSTYSLSDAVPFRIRLSSSCGTLRELFPPSSDLLLPETGTKWKKNKGGTFAIRVSLARQIVVDIDGIKTYRKQTIGKGTMWPVPPAVPGRSNLASAEDSVCLDWEGEVRCGKDVSCGGFNAGILHVKDFLVFELVPPVSMQSQLSPIEVVRSVRFVKDPRMDVVRMTDRLR